MESQHLIQKYAWHNSKVIGSTSNLFNQDGTLTDTGKAYAKDYTTNNSSSQSIINSSQVSSNNSQGLINSNQVSSNQGNSTRDNSNSNSSNSSDYFQINLVLIIIIFILN